VQPGKTYPLSNNTVFGKFRMTAQPFFGKTSGNNSVRKTGLQRNKIKKCGNKTKKIHNTIETQIYVVHPVWAMSTREIVKSFLLLSNKMKGYNLQHTHYNFLFLISQSPLSEYNIHNNPQPQYNSLIK
jgi:hypothetical protein